MDSGRLEAVPPGAVHLDTVRALHRTVVSLRTALEVSKNELKELKEKYQQHSQCLEYADVIEKLTVENHILRRKIIDSDHETQDFGNENANLKGTYSSQSHYPSDVVITTDNKESHLKELEAQDSDEINLNSEHIQLVNDSSNICSTNHLPEIPQELSLTPEKSVSNDISPHVDSNTEVEEYSAVETSQKEEDHNPIHQPSFKTKLELLSKFDVRIKVRTLKEGTIVSSTTSDTDSSTTEGWRKKEEEKGSVNFEFKEELASSKTINIKSVSTDNITMAVPNEADVKSKTGKFDVQVRITSEENLVVKENVERSRRKDTLNLDVDDLSFRSMSEGDNSVFSESGTTPVDRYACGDDKQEQDDASGNESEEVDDIELIFTTDESKDMSNLQEDLVSIRETDQWVPQSASTTHSTPVLIKFHTLDPDFQPGTESKELTDDTQENVAQIPEKSLAMKRVSLPNDKEIRHVAFNGKGNLELPGRGILKSCDNKSDNMLYKRSPNTSSRRLDSIDSLTCEYNRGLSFDNTKSSSFELGSSMDILHRDESIDSFHRTCHLGHRFSVFAERDISKCGTSEDDLAAHLNVRRNTCPNPFQYRLPSSHRVSRPPGPFKAPITTGRIRPVLRDCSMPRRENGAQTDVSALPPRWSSDGYLAHKMSMPSTTIVPTVPQRSAVAGSRRLTVPDARPPPLVRRNDEARRILLSDIGFTSMVPELSRSADPVWALSKKQHSEDSVTTSTSKFLSRGSSYRSPCLSIDRSNDWTPQHIYVPSSRAAAHRPWRSSLPDVRRDDTEELLEEAEIFLRRSIDNLQAPELDFDKCTSVSGQPYIPAEPRHLRLGHTVKVITPHGRIAVGRVRYVGLAGGSAASSSVVVGAEFVHAQYPGLARNDGTYRGRRYFLAPPKHAALFVPFSKVVMAWAN